MKRSLLILCFILSFSWLSAQIEESHKHAVEVHNAAIEMHNKHIDVHNSHMEQHRQIIEQEERLNNNRIVTKRVKRVIANDPNIRFTGRTIVEKDGSVSFDWSGTYVEFTFTGGYLAMRVSDTKKNYYNLFINGEQVSVITTFGKDSLVVLARNLKKRENVVRLQKRTEAEQGKTTIHSFVVNPKGDILTFNPKRERHIEFIGNSITAGFGTEGLAKDEPFKPETQNCNLAFGAIISRYFNADYTFIAHSGWGAVRNYGDPERVSKTSMKNKMLQTFDMYDTPMWNFSDYKPDLVVINLGSNDFSTKPHPLKEEFIGAYAQIISQLREKYGNIPILCVAPARRGMAFEYIKEFCEESKDVTLHFTAYLYGIYNNDGDLGSVGHPNYQGQKKIAHNLIPYISTITGWELSDKVIE